MVSSVFNYNVRDKGMTVALENSKIILIKQSLTMAGLTISVIGIGLIIMGIKINGLNSWNNNVF